LRYCPNAANAPEPDFLSHSGALHGSGNWPYHQTTFTRHPPQRAGREPDGREFRRRPAAQRAHRGQPQGRPGESLRSSGQDRGRHRRGTRDRPCRHRAAARQRRAGRHLGRRRGTGARRGARIRHGRRGRGVRRRHPRQRCGRGLRDGDHGALRAPRRAGEQRGHRRPERPAVGIPGRPVAAGRRCRPGRHVPRHARRRAGDVAPLPGAASSRWPASPARKAIRT